MTLLVLVGIPACGKTTFAHWRRNEALRDGRDCQAIVSSDELRRMVCGDERDMRYNGLAFEFFHYLIDQLLMRPAFHVTADAANLRKADRARLVAMAHTRGHEAHAVVFVDAISAIYRNRERERPLPDEIMERVCGHLSDTLETIDQEGFDLVERM